MALQKGNGRLLKILLLAAFLNGIVWSGLIPMWQTPDEQAHFAQAQNIVVGKNASGTADLDTGPTTSKDIVTAEFFLGTYRINGNNLFTYHPENRIEYTNSTYGKYEREIESSPLSDREEFLISEATGYPLLYYQYLGLVNKIFWNNGLITRVFISRLATVLIATLTTYAVYLLAGEIFKNNFYAFVTASLVSFHPMWRFAGSGVTSDALFNLIYPLLIYGVIKLVKGDKKYFWWILAIFILGLMTKLQIMLLTPILIPILIWIAVSCHSEPRRGVARILLLIVLFIALITVGNYLMPDFTFYWMGKLGLKWLSETLFLPELSYFGDKIGFIGYWKTMAKELYIQGFPWYWGVYRWLSLTLPLGVYRMIKIVILISLAGWGLAMVKWLKGRGKSKWAIKNKGWIVILISSSVYALGLLTWNFFFWRSHGYSFGIQGRYFFPNLPEHMILLLGGWLLLAGNWIVRKWIGIVLTGMMMLFNWYTLYFVLASYYDVTKWVGFLVQASQYKPWFLKVPVLPVIIFLGVASSVWFLINLVKYNKKKYA